MFFDVFRWLRKIPVAFLIYCYILLIYRYLIYNLKVLASSKSLIEGFILNFLYYTTNNEVKNLNSTLERRLVSITNKINIREQYNLSSINLFKVNNKSTKTICEICLKLTIKTQVVNDVVLVSLLLPVNRFHTISVVSIADFRKISTSWGHCSRLLFFLIP